MATTLDTCKGDMTGVNSMTESERKSMVILADTIKGEINRMCVTKDLVEFGSMYGHAKKNIEKLSMLIYDTRFREEHHECDC